MAGNKMREDGGSRLFSRKAHGRKGSLPQDAVCLRTPAAASAERRIAVKPLRTFERGWHARCEDKLNAMNLLVILIVLMLLLGGGGFYLGGPMIGGGGFGLVLLILLVLFFTGRLGTR